MQGIEDGHADKDAGGGDRRAARQQEGNEREEQHELGAEKIGLKVGCPEVPRVADLPHLLPARQAPRGAERRGLSD